MMAFTETTCARRVLLLLSVLIFARKIDNACVEGFVATASYVARTIPQIRVPRAIKSSHSALAASIVSNHLTSELAKECLDLMASDSTKEACQQWADQLGLDMTAPEVGFYALFTAVRQCATLGVRDGQPFCLRRKDVMKALDAHEHSIFAGFFTFDDLAKAVQDDFLDAARGSTDNRKGWKVW